MIADLWAQFTALGSTIILVYGLSKVPWVRTLWYRNVVEPVKAFIERQLHPLHEKADAIQEQVTSNHDKLYELAGLLDYEFRANGGNSMRDRVNAAVTAAGGIPDPGCRRTPTASRQD